MRNVLDLERAALQERLQRTWTARSVSSELLVTRVARRGVGRRMDRPATGCARSSAELEANIELQAPLCCAR